MLADIVRAMRRSTRFALKATRSRRWKNARSIRERLRRERLALAATVKRAREGPTEDSPMMTADEALHAQVLGILQDHPEGLRAQDIGNQLGIDWRGVAGVMSTLVARGLVEQVEHGFYPAAKASRRC